MATKEDNHVVRKILTPVILGSGIIANALQISTFSGRTAEKLALWILSAFGTGVFLVAFGSSILRCIGDFFLAIGLVLNIHRSGTPKSHANHLRDHIRKLMKERLATTTEVNQVIIEAPMLKRLPEANRCKSLEQIRDELAKTKIVWRREHQVGTRSFEFDFDVFQFSTASNTGLSITMTHITHDIQSKFESIRFQTIIHLVREEQHYGLSPFFDEIQKFMHFDTSLGFLLPTRKWERDPLFMQTLSRACEGKSVLLVEPIMIDTGLDKAFDAITQAGGKIEGLLVLFEVKGFRCKSLDHYQQLMKIRGANDLRGQVLLDLHETN